MKYPIGIQSFENLRSDGWVYVDKTALVHRLVSTGKYYFLSRPRRFGKSLLLSTLKAYFEGKKHLFNGLAMMQLEHEWRVHPVLHLDLNIEKYDSLESLDNILESNLSYWEEKYGAEPSERSFSLRFAGIVRRAYEKTGERVVVLVDEYDKPILQAIGNEQLQDQLRNSLKAFYGVLKSADAYIRFTMLTGVTKFGKVSVFSDLNNLEDISMSEQFSGICGISDKELHDYFDDEIGELAKRNSTSKDVAYEELRMRYDGYHFAPNTSGIYNPFSILLSLKNRNYGSYWFATGTPTYLVELLKNSKFNLQKLSGYETSESALSSIHNAHVNPVSVLFQSGYLTIKGYDEELKLYMLDFPNEEVRHGFINCLMPIYTSVSEQDSPAFIGNFVREVRSGKVDDFMNRLRAILADTPYELIRELENHYQNVMYIITKLMGFYVQAEYRTSNGRIDLLIGTDKYVYIIELKFEGSSQMAMKQIESKRYDMPFATDDRKVIKIGANISSETRNIDEWIVAEN